MISGTDKVSFRRRLWQPRCGELPPADALTQLANQLKCEPLVAQLLAARGLGDANAAADFLSPQFRNLHPPELLPNLTPAAELIAAFARDKSPILIFGDYDVDGITGTAMLWRLLKSVGANVDYYIPHRIDEGYGLSLKAVEDAANNGCKLLITIDCGIAGAAAVELARSRGMTVIVTDHHELPATLPPAHFIIHPRLVGSTYPNAHLCGSGVAFKLAWGLAVALCRSATLTETLRRMLIEFSALAALGTVADVMPLVGENRILVRYGLAQLPFSSLVGLQALIGAAGYSNRKIDGTAIGFSLAPRLNAAGRMGHARAALEMLLTDDAERATKIAHELERCNTERQAVERKISQTAKDMVHAAGELPAAIVLYEKQWHAGVVGIVASRMVDAFHRPAFILTEESGVLVGSGRSIPGFDLHVAIEHCRELIISGGGHSAAGGVKLLPTNLSLFQQKLAHFARNTIPKHALIPTLDFDCAVQANQLTHRAVESLDRMAPFGHGNPRPRFVLTRATIARPPRIVKGSHLQLHFAADGCQLRGIAWRMGELEPCLAAGVQVDVLVEPHLDAYNGMPRVDLHVVDIARSDRRPLQPTPSKPQPAVMC
ncbi:MAG: single-stranded-DNA-specific exonuclease RecJ [Phycisphaerae bacterium]